jgi:CTP:molybdopterin cytidylyltransferase MocA
MITSGSIALDISGHLHVDIDYPEDWVKAEQIYKLMRS